ncbi:MAG: RagB/SusD family nutrient uptake outer membrane protein [Bacteroidales bacterium]|nr:RagB/SusD family nutrient uptake outer membrane protein [Bacteroidales bacterium]
MKKFSKKYIAIIAILVLSLSCSEDFLERKPIAQQTEESFYETFSDLDLTATAAYGMLCSRDIFDIFYLFAHGCVGADDSECGGENTGDWPEIQNVDRMIHTTADERIFITWAYLYKGIRICNDYLYKVPEVFTVSEDEYPDVLKQRIAEMKYLRAMFHFCLTQTYGGVPICIEKSDPAAPYPARNTIKEVYEVIEQDLKDAIPYLKEKSQLGSGEAGRASKGAARALLAKVLLYESSYAENYGQDENKFGAVEQRYDEALQYAEEVISSGEYELVGVNGERYDSWRDSTGDGGYNGNGVGGYRWIFTMDGDNSPESVWEVQNVLDLAGWTESRGSYWTTYSTIRYVFNSSDVSTVAGGWSFNLPTSYLIDAFGNSDPRETGLNSAVVDPTLDPRYETTIGEPGDTIYLSISGDGLGWYEMDFVNLPTNTISRKYECSPNEFWGRKTNDNEGPMNLRQIRYADVVLMAAEAAFKSGNTGAALNYVNQVRTRARESGNTGYPQDLGAISFEDIVHERRIELAMEGHRFFDLVRWGLADDFISNTELAVYPGFIVDFEVGKHEFFPIPLTEIQLSAGALEQYPGWQ